jgi:hypothetical protein
MHNPDEYSFGKCLYCNEIKPLKNGICNSCSLITDEDGLPDFMKNLFGGFNEQEKK